ncbi:MAG: trypsin-like peptidase domain-containing protein, partial [Planctomycetales bacterium]|nr:trypsin-like peptidase domain-containing protein [Planctomycetales bacterium]
MAAWIISALLCAAVGGSSDCTIVHFTASWSSPCKQVQPSLARLEQEGWDVRRVDVDQHPELVQQFAVQNLPTLVLFCRDQEVDRLVGAAPYEQIQQRAQRAAARNQSTPPPATPTTPATAAEHAAATAQPIVRGQSPSLGAYPMLASLARSLPAEHEHEHEHEPSAVQASPSQSKASASPSRSAPASSFAASAPSSTPPAAALSIPQAIARAAAATVRIRVDEAQSTAFGTGTIVDVHGQEALILTCGHLFRDMQPQSQLTIDLFPGTAQEVNLPSQLIDFRAEGEDIGLISFRIPVAIEPVPILPRGERLQIGQQVFSFGCDHGANPTRRDTQIKNINRYTGADNLEIAGAPAVGRSGGGLFDLQGRLIGVCNAADAMDDEGIYAAAEVVYQQIERLDLGHLFAQTPRAAAPSDPP